jgi:hypothetical protein
MKRITQAQADAAAMAKDRARVILKLYMQRRGEEAQSKSAPSMTAIVIDVLRRGCMVTSSPESGSLHMNSRQRWLVSVDWVLSEIGHVDAAILLARLTRREKSIEASYATIGGEIRSTLGVELIEREMRVRFGKALARFLELLDARGIDRHCNEESATSRAYQTFAPQDHLVPPAAAPVCGPTRTVASMEVLKLVGAATLGKIRMQTVVRRLRKSTRVAEAI